jgi:hypothetical protein
MAFISDLSNFIPVGAHAQRNDLSAVKTITPVAGLNADVVMLQCQTQNVRFTLDGTDPTTSKGFLLKAGDPPILVRPATLKAIEVTTTAVMDTQWGRATGLNI